MRRRRGEERSREGTGREDRGTVRHDGHADIRGSLTPSLDTPLYDRLCELVLQNLKLRVCDFGSANVQADPYVTVVGCGRKAVAVGNEFRSLR